MEILMKFLSACHQLLTGIRLGRPIVMTLTMHLKCSFAGFNSTPDQNSLIARRMRDRRHKLHERLIYKLYLCMWRLILLCLLVSVFLQLLKMMDGTM